MQFPRALFVKHIMNRHLRQPPRGALPPPSRHAEALSVNKRKENLKENDLS